MRPTRPMPKTLPLTANVQATLENVVSAPRPRLCDDSLRSLLRECHDGSWVWLTGSTCWLPAAFGEEPDRNGDLDLVFADRERCEKFVKRAIERLNRGIPKGARGFEVVENSFGSGRIKHPDGRHVMDCWYTQPNETIFQVLEGYPEHLGMYTRCAYEPRHGCLVRTYREAGSPFASIAKSKSKSSYPGA